MAKPILKWPGGKTWSLDLLKPYLNTETLAGHTFYEPFLGGGAVAFSLGHPDSVINDLNGDLINLYKVVRDFPSELIFELSKFTQFHSEKFYYSVRSWDRAADFLTRYSEVERAARTIYLNKTCFNGLYRVNSKGFFNVPLGRTATNKLPDIVQADKIYELSAYLQSGVVITNLDYKEVILAAKPGDILYLDPPYTPFPDKDGFVNYQKSGWTESDLINLRNLCNFKVDQGCKIIVTNNAAPKVIEAFNDPRYNCQIVSAKRSINCDGNGRGAVKEVLITSTNFNV